MEKVKHLLSFVASSEADMLTVHLDSDGIDFLMERLSILKDLLEKGQCEHCHLFTPESIGSELTSSKLLGQANEAIVVQQVKICAWTKDWAREHKLIEE